MLIRHDRTCNSWLLHDDISILQRLVVPIVIIQQIAPDYAPQITVRVRALTAEVCSTSAMSGYHFLSGGVTAEFSKYLRVVLP